MCLFQIWFPQCVCPEVGTPLRFWCIVAVDDASGFNCQPAFFLSDTQLMVTLMCLRFSDMWCERVSLIICLLSPPKGNPAGQAVLGSFTAWV